MAYVPTDWRDGAAGGTPLNEAALDRIEQGIADAHSLIASLQSATHTHTSADITDATSQNVVDTLVLRDNEGGIAVTRVTGLSTATSATGAVPKSQLDDGLASKAASTHTHAYSPTGHTHTTADIGSFTESVVATIGTTVVQGENTTVVYDELTQTVTINADAGAGLTEVNYDDLPPGDTLTIVKNADGTWPDRYTPRTDIHFRFIGPDPDPDVVESPAVNGMYEADTRYVTP